MAPRLSVVIPSYGAQDLLSQTLRSLAEQEYPASGAEIIVIDDGSPGFDSSTIDGLTAPFSLTTMHFDRNRGRAAARNTGIGTATGEIVVFLDGDMTVQPGFLVAHDRFHDGDRAIAVGEIRWAAHVPSIPLTRYIHSRGVAHFGRGDVPFKCFVTGNSSVPRWLLHEAGLFDEIFSTYGGEDLELGYRLYQLGARVCHEPDAVSLHHQFRSLDVMCRAMRTYGETGLRHLLSKHPELAGLLHVDFLELPA
ncbi:uncharacterized protein METZ01_LOCUS381386, partial [marine metagenome]